MAASELFYMALLFQATLALDPGALDWLIMSSDGTQVKTNSDIPFFLKQMMSSMIPRGGILRGMPQTFVQEVKEQTFVPNQMSILGAADMQPYSPNTGTNPGLIARVEDILTPKLAPQPLDTDSKETQLRDVSLDIESTTASDETEREPTTDLVQGMARKKRQAPFRALWILESNNNVKRQQQPNI